MWTVGLPLLRELMGGQVSEVPGGAPSLTLQLWDWGWLRPEPRRSEGGPLSPRVTQEAPWSARSPPAGSSWPAS